MNARQLVGLVSVVGCFGLFSGCGDEGPTGSLTIAAPALLTIVQGDSAEIDFTITRTDYTGNVDFAVLNVPVNVELSVLDSSTTDGVTTGKIHVVVDSSAKPLTYLLKLQATGSNVAAGERPLTIVVENLPHITLSVPAEHFNLTPGNSRSLDFGIGRINFTDTVRFSLEGGPPGVTGIFSPAATVDDSSTVLVQLAPDAAPAGTYTLTIRASGTGIRDATGTFLLTVKEIPAFSLAADDVTIAAGASGTTTVTVTRTNFVDPIDFSADSLPDGVTASFAPDSTTGDTSTLTLTVGAGVTPGVYTITIKGIEVVPSTTSSVIQRSPSNPVKGSTTFDLTVTSAP